MPRSIKALYITGWHKWFEPTYKRGSERCYYMGCPGWFRERIHTGERRRRLFADVGRDEALLAIAVYDQLRQYAAAQSVEKRGWLLDAFGSPMSPSDLVAMLERSWAHNAVTRRRGAAKRRQGAADCPSGAVTRPQGAVERQISTLEQHKWIIRAQYVRNPNGPCVPATRSYERLLCAFSAHSGAHTVTTECAPTGQGNRTAGHRTRSKDKAEDACLPSPSSPGGLAALSALPDQAGPTMQRVLKLIGFDDLAIVQIINTAGEVPDLVLEAAECAEILQNAGQLRSTARAYIRSYIEAGGYTLPGELEKKRKRRRV